MTGSDCCKEFVNLAVSVYRWNEFYGWLNGLVRWRTVVHVIHLQPFLVVCVYLGTVASRARFKNPSGRDKMMKMITMLLVYTNMMLKGDNMNSTISSVKKWDEVNLWFVVHHHQHTSVQKWDEVNPWFVVQHHQQTCELSCSNNLYSGIFMEAIL